MNDIRLPVLYSFRRCPYAMRARMAILKGGKFCRLREVELRRMPEQLTIISPKATVPVLVQETGELLEESIDIMLWALADCDPDNWLMPDHGNLSEMLDLVKELDGEFKHHLDRYKYSSRYKDADPDFHKNRALAALNSLIARLDDWPNLFGHELSLADIAIFPFIRQFANTDRTWFDGLQLVPLQSWLDRNLQSDLFVQIMRKEEVWRVGDKEPVFPPI